MSSRITSSILLSLGLLFSLSGSAEEAGASASANDTQTLASVTERYPSGAINSAETADQALQDVKRQRALAQERFAREAAVCYEKFFVTACVDAAKDRRRMALKQLESIEVEANAFLRRSRAEKRDQVLRERQAKQDAQDAERTDTQSTDGKADAPAGSDDIAELERQTREAASASSAAPARNYNTERAAQRAQKLARQKEQEIAEAQERAENIRAYEKKQQRSLERQREIAAKKEAKERVRAAEKAN